MIHRKLANLDVHNLHAQPPVSSLRTAANRVRGVPRPGDRVRSNNSPELGIATVLGYKANGWMCYHYASDDDEYRVAAPEFQPAFDVVFRQDKDIEP